ncbi:MAG TPA: Xaa-Pro peptidase family protein [Puia sp.]|uniref:M24 family metallopeptidase n=1 Tax=Puia sp. TaxID=2045100 RepID=UPI002C39C0B9|nr:Xaa-Pro peptidase family protein [Puia sp.]HVU96935.1 Xaa-Pro peptidase family protein [Puia sp.]
MSIKRRDFLRLSAGSSLGGVLLSGLPVAGLEAGARPAAVVLEALQPMTGDVVPITLEERKGRIQKAQRLMGENKIDAILLDSGTSMVYFTGMGWGASERPMVAIVPAYGDVKYVCPAFEAERLRELITIGTEVRVWEEHESPYKVMAGIVKDFGIRTGTVGVEERVRFFIFDGLRKEAPQLNYVSADPVTATCRMIKSPAELALMQKANDITVAAYKACIALLHEGMTPADFSSTAENAFSRLGVRGGLSANFGQASAFPHGSIQTQHLQKGDVVLMDDGCKVQGYCSDISRCIVFGAEPTKRQREVWELEKRAQAAGFAAAKVGAPCENVDLAARKVITDAGFGPGYKIPGLPHRTGHGIGMDIHEWGNMVMGNKTPLQPGMCFSVEPMVAIYGEFGMRLEDCAYMTEDGPRWFSQPSPSIDQPFAS